MKLASFWKLSNLRKYRNIRDYNAELISLWPFLQEILKFLREQYYLQLQERGGRVLVEGLYKFIFCFYKCTGCKVPLQSSAPFNLSLLPTGVLGCPSMKQWYHLSIIHPLSHISPFLNAFKIFWYLHLGEDTHIWINTWLQNVNFHSEVRSFR